MYNPDENFSQNGDPINSDALKERLMSAPPSPFAVKFSYGVLILGILLLIPAVYTSVKNFQLLANSSTTIGTVTGQSSETSSHRNSNSGVTRKITNYFPVISFTTKEGQEITFTGNGGSENSSDFPEGRQVPVRYDNNNPKNAVINTFADMWTAQIAFFLAGLFLVLVGFWLVLSARKKMATLTK